MDVLRVMLKYAGYYIMITASISFFGAVPVRGVLNTVCGAALSVSMFAAIIQLLIDGDIGLAAHRVSAWCLRGTVIITAIVIIAGIGIDKIAKLFITG